METVVVEIKIFLPSMFGIHSVSDRKLVFYVLWNYGSIITTQYETNSYALKQHIYSRGPQTACLPRSTLVVTCQRSAWSVSNRGKIFLLNEGHKFQKIETKKSRDKFQFQTIVDN